MSRSVTTIAYPMTPRCSELGRRSLVRIFVLAKRGSQLYKTLAETNYSDSKRDEA
jgi:hypothetical protein